MRTLKTRMYKFGAFYQLRRNYAEMIFLNYKHVVSSIHTDKTAGALDDFEGVSCIMNEKMNQIESDRGLLTVIRVPSTFSLSFICQDRYSDRNFNFIFLHICISYNFLYAEKENLLRISILLAKIVSAWNFCKFDRYSSKLHCFFVDIRDFSINIIKMPVKFRE